MRQPLLVCLDLQRAFADPGPLRAPHAASALLESARLLALARRERWHIIHCLLRRDESTLCVSGDMALPVSGFSPRSSESVIERASLSAYGHAAFGSLIEATQHRTALVAGLSASLTFVATAIDAFERGHRLFLAADALAAQDGSEAQARDHEAVARDIAAQLGFPAARMNDALPDERRSIEFSGGRHD